MKFFSCNFGADVIGEKNSGGVGVGIPGFVPCVKLNVNVDQQYFNSCR